MKINKNKQQKQKRPLDQYQVPDPQFFEQQKSLQRMDKLISKYKKILIKIMRKADILSQNDFTLWDQMDNQVTNQRKTFYSQGSFLFKKPFFLRSPAQDLKINEASFLYGKFFSFRQHIFNVKIAISYYKHFPKMNWIEQDYDIYSKEFDQQKQNVVQTDEIIQQKLDKGIYILNEKYQISFDRRQKKANKN